MNGMSVDTDRWMNLAVYWGSRILAAIAILIVAHFVAKAVKWAIAKGVDALPGATHHNARKGTQADRNTTVGARLGDVGYWLVLLIGVIAALNVLELGAVVEPLNAMLYQFGEYIPRIIGAVVLFFIGYVVATLVKRIVESALEAANLDHWLDKLGLRRLTGASGLAKTVGTIVFVLIIIPFAISALGVLNIAAISGPTTEVLNQVLSAVPRIIAAALVLTLAYVVARWVGSLIEQILPSFGFDQMFGRMMGGGASPSTTASSTPMSSSTLSSSTVRVTETPSTLSSSGAETPAQAASRSAATMTPSKVVANIAMVAIILFVAVQAAHILGFAAIAGMLEELLSLFSRILFGGAIIAAGVALAQFLSRMLGQTSGPSSQLASTIVRWVAIGLSVAIGLRFMGLANEIVIIAFAAIVGSAAVAAAVAFGIGGIQPARAFLERYTNRGPQL